MIIIKQSQQNDAERLRIHVLNQRPISFNIVTNRFPHKARPHYLCLLQAMDAYRFGNKGTSI